MTTRAAPGLRYGERVAIEPHPLDDDALKREMEQALQQLPADPPPRSSASESGRGDAGERTRIQGRIVGIRDRDVFVDYGGKSEGFLPLDEFEAEHPPAVGQVFEFIPHGFDRDSGQMRLSLREVRIAPDWNSIKRGDLVEGRVTGVNIGGLELTIHGLRAFMPKSQVDLSRHEEFSGFVGRRLECEVTEIDRRGRNILVSRRRVLERRRDEEREQVKQHLEVGQTFKGVVRRLTDFGAFVDIGGIEGLVHISDLSHSRLSHPQDVVKVGEEIEVQILKLDLEKNRISLGRKQLQADPWTLVPANYSAGAAVEGRVTRLADFGAFVELEPGVEGLVPLSELSWTQRVRHPRDIVKENDRVRVSVLSVDPEKRRISLSLRALVEDPWQAVSERYPAGAVVSGMVARLAAFGAFVQLGDGIEGLVHISELSRERVKQVSDVVKPGEVVQCKVLSVDLEQHRVSLSIRATQAPPPPPPGMPAAAPPPEPVADDRPGRKKKERPLRGGLSW